MAAVYFQRALSRARRANLDKVFALRSHSYHHAVNLDVRHVLGDDGALRARLGARFEPRPQQVAMAEAVAAAMRDTSNLLVEAGTGTGKSFAYLLPAIERCIAHNETVVVATNTIALQEQLVGKDVPFLLEALGDAVYGADGTPRVRPVLVKGRGNYVSIRRLALASQRQDAVLPDAASKRTLHTIEDWAYTTTDGTLSTLPQLERPAVWDKVQSDSGNCMGKRCPHHDACFYQRARREAESANLLICNHALFFSDLALRAEDAGFLPHYDHVVLDEAHCVEDVAADHFGLAVSSGQVAHLLTTLYNARVRKGYLVQLQRLGVDLDAVNTAIERTLAADSAADEFFAALAGQTRTGAVRNGRLRAADAVENTLTPAMNDLALRLRALREDIKNDADRFELNAYSLRAAAIADAAEALVSQTEPGAVYWIETGGRSRDTQRVELACSPIDVAPLLRAHLFEKDCSVVLASATLTTRTASADEPTEHAETAFAHAIGRLGCAGAKTLQLGSPFEHAAQVELFVDRAMPQPHKGELEAGYLHALCSRIHDHVVATDGGAFVLFTSHRLLEAAADRLAGPLGALDMPVYVQGRDGSRTAHLTAFRQSERSVLFGAASFWQGVDVAGSTLRNVIITRLPFDPPDRPLTEARCEAITARGGNAFMEDTLPRAILRFKQGYGRLIRSTTDTGRVVVLDPRLVTKPYGRLFLAALPEGLEVRVMGDD